MVNILTSPLVLRHLKTLSPPTPLPQGERGERKNAVAVAAALALACTLFQLGVPAAKAPPEFAFHRRIGTESQIT
jgi:hypothetical protein